MTADVLRLLVKPGITGLWQVSGRAEGRSWNQQAVRLDLSYVDNWSMTSDLLIIAKTVGAVLRGAVARTRSSVCGKPAHRDASSPAPCGDGRSITC